MMMAPLESAPQLGAPAVERRGGDAEDRELGLSLEARPAEPESGLGAPPPRLAAARGEGVAHTYRQRGADETSRSGRSTCTFGRGELVFLIGGNGSGKTTLAKLLLGLYRRRRARSASTACAVTDANRDAYRAALLRGVLGLLPVRHAARARDARSSTSDAPALPARAAARPQGARSRRAALDDRPSQGQRKRLALLTAYLEDRPIYVFDEWAADQDPTSRRSSTASSCRSSRRAARRSS